MDMPRDPSTDIPENRRRARAVSKRYNKKPSENMEKIVLLTGGFDPVHIGHVRMFKEAKRFGDKVFVGLNSDPWLTRKKGKPFMPYAERQEILQSIKYIDRVFSFSDKDNTAVRFIKSMNEVYLNNPNVKLYFGNGGDRTGTTTPEVEFCKENGIKLIFELGGGKIQSSSKLTGVK